MTRLLRLAEVERLVGIKRPTIYALCRQGRFPADIATGYAAVGVRLSVRQAFYLCVVRTLIENSEREYRKLIRLLTDVREAGFFDWDVIEDRGPIPGCENG